MLKCKGKTVSRGYYIVTVYIAIIEKYINFGIVYA